MDTEENDEEDSEYSMSMSQSVSQGGADSRTKEMWNLLKQKYLGTGQNADDSDDDDDSDDLTVSESMKLKAK